MSDPGSSIPAVRTRGLLDGLRELSGERRDKIVTYTLVEVLTILVFLAAAYGVLSKDEAEREIRPLRDTIEALEGRVASLESEVRLLESERDRLEHIVGLLRDAWREIEQKQVTANPSQEELEQFLERLRTRADAVASAMNQAPGKPVCRPPERFLVEVDLLAEGMRVRPQWSADFDETATLIDGLTEFATGELLTRSEFRELARRVAQSRTDCTFQIVTYLRHNDAGLYQRQLDDANLFYAARR